MTSNYNKKKERKKIPKLHFTLIAYDDDDDDILHGSSTLCLWHPTPSILRFRFLFFYQFHKIADDYLALGAYNAFWMELNPLQF
jgi:hypothetical protein